MNYVMQVPRGLGHIAVLTELARGEKKLSKIAESLGITVQAVSEAVQNLRARGYVLKDNRLTPDGAAYLEQEIENLGLFVRRGYDSITRMKVIEAIAGDDIKKGENVGLFMEQGVLMAYPEMESSSTGTAVNDASKGEDVGVTETDGIVDLKHGSVKVVVLPSISRGGSRVVDYEMLKPLVEQGDIVCSVDYVSLVSLKKMGVRPDIVHAPVESTVYCTRSGLNVVMLVSEDMKRFVLHDLSENDVRFEVEVI